MKWHIHTVGYYSVMKKHELCHCGSMDGPRGHRTQGSEPGKDKRHMSPITVERLKKKWVQMNLSAKEKQTHRHRE